MILLLEVLFAINFYVNLFGLSAAIFELYCDVDTAIESFYHPCFKYYPCTWEQL